MKSVLKAIQAFHEDESGHIVPGAANLIPATGAVVLAIGAASNSDVVTIIGGVALALGLVIASFLRHREIDYDIYARLEVIEKK
jgi:hypothetical protein